MKWGRHIEKKPVSGMTIIGGLLLVGLTYVALMSIPEFVRYLRIRRM